MSGKYKRIKLPDGTSRDEHRLIVEEYLGYKLDSDIVVHHLDDDKSNNDLENLDICLKGVHTRYHLNEESINRLRNLEKVYGSRVGTSKLTEDDVRTIKDRLERGERQIDIANDFNVDKATIFKIKVGETWRRV